MGFQERRFCLTFKSNSWHVVRKQKCNQRCCGGFGVLAQELLRSAVTMQQNQDYARNFRGSVIVLNNEKVPLMFSGPTVRPDVGL